MEFVKSVFYKNRFYTTGKGGSPCVCVRACVCRQPLCAPTIVSYLGHCLTQFCGILSNDVLACHGSDWLTEIWWLDPSKRTKNFVSGSHFAARSKGRHNAIIWIDVVGDSARKNILKLNGQETHLSNTRRKTLPSILDLKKNPFSYSWLWFPLEVATSRIPAKKVGNGF